MSAFILQNIRERISLKQSLYNCEPYDLEMEKLFGLYLDLAKTDFSNWIVFLREHTMNSSEIYTVHILYSFSSLIKLLLITCDVGNVFDSLTYVPAIVRK